MGAGSKILQRGVGSQILAEGNDVLTFNEDFWKAYAASKLGLNGPNEVAGYLNHFMGDRPTRTFLLNGGVQNASPAKDGGQISLSAPAGTDAAFVLADLVGAVKPVDIENGKTSNYFIVGRGKLTSIPGAATQFGVGISDLTTATVLLGVNGAETHYTFKSGATTITSKVLRDTNMHWFAWWVVGTIIYISVDFESPETAPNTNLPEVAAELLEGVVGDNGAGTDTAIFDCMGIFTPLGT